MGDLKDALEAICRYADPDKLELKKDKDGMWKIGLGLHVTAAEAHHVMTVMEELEDTQPVIPNLTGSNGVQESRVGF